jgi:hypothetical protein
MKKYFYTDGVDKYGPFTKDELANQRLNQSVKIWYLGLDDWTPITELPELSGRNYSEPPELPKSQSKFERFTQNKTVNFIRKRWLFLVLIVSVLLIIVFSVTKQKFLLDEYNTIVDNSYDTNEDFSMYVEKFYRDLEFYGIYPNQPKIQIIKFSRLDQIKETTHIHGLSYGFDDDDRIEIYINPTTWNKFNKPMRHFLMYHELAHDVLNLDDLDINPSNEKKLMYGSLSTYANVDMDDFIESYHELFEEYAAKMNAHSTY